MNEYERKTSRRPGERKVATTDEYSPGPWRVEKVGDGQFAIKDIDGNTVFCPDHGWHGGRLHSAASARLAAAAPALLAALRWALRVWFDVLARRPEPWTDAAFRAIEAATGEKEV